MKSGHKIFGALTGLLLLTGVIWQSVVVVHFYLNQEKIEALYCVNKDKPQLNCHGQCHLKETLAPNTSSQVATEQTPQSLKTLLVILTFQSQNNSFLVSDEQSEKLNFPYIEKPLSTYISPIIDPPEYC